MKQPWQLVSDGEEVTRRLGRLCGETAPGGAALFLCGELGAGKTCFSQGVADGLGVPPDVPVTSPSYTLLNLYHGRLPLYHFDLYRLGDPDELVEIGFEDCLRGHGLTLVEWLDRFPDLRPDGLLVRLEYGVGERQRLVSLSPRGRIAEDWLARVRSRWEAQVPAAHSEQQGGGQG